MAPHLVVAVERKDCRACGSTDLVSVLDLKDQPLANRFLTRQQLAKPEPRYPLHMVRCARCGLCQLTHVVDPEVLYRDYAYQSGFSEGWLQHCGALAVELAERYPGGSVLDVAANDGSLLRACRGRGLRVQGVDPARNLDHGDLPITREFWPVDLGERFDVIVAQNVFGHVDDARGFLQGIAGALQEGGVAIIECPWLVDLIRHCRWDTIYHEHLSYWGLCPLLRLAREVGLQAEKVWVYPDLHGGTMRVYLKQGSDDLFGSWGVKDMAQEEGRRLTEDAFLEFGLKASVQRNQWADYFRSARGVAAYGASAKFNTLLNALPERPPLMGIFDDNPSKWDRYTPGWHIPVLCPSIMSFASIQELLVGAPNWISVIEPKARELGFTGRVKSVWG